MTKHFPVIFEQDVDGVFIVSCPVLKGCRSYGNSVQDALVNIREAIELCLEDEVGIQDENIEFVGIRDIEMVV